MAYSHLMSNVIGSTNLTTSWSEDIQNLIEKLLSLEKQQQTTAVVITSAFSLAASLLVIGSIYYDAYSNKAWDPSSSRKKRLNIFSVVHPAEVFPLAIAIAAVVQAIIFIAVQSRALTTFWSNGCRLTSELIWPAVWLVALVVLIFSLETTFRSLCKTRFCPRRKWDTPVYIGVIIVLLIGLWLSAFLVPSPDMCPGFLMWWTEHYTKPAIVLAGGMMLTHVISAIVIVVRLLSTTKIDRSERIAASRIVYSLVINTIILAFLLPFCVERATLRFERYATQVADIGITLSGLLHAVLHVVLRGNSDRLAIRARHTPWSRKRKIRLFGPNDLSIGAFISTPLLAAPSFEKDSQSQLEKGLGLMNATPTIPGPLTQYATQTTDDPNASEPLPLAKPQTAAQKRRRTKSNYSIFPTRASTQPGRPSWATADTADGIMPPAPLFSKRHNRELSSQSGETVEIGLRISHAGLENLSPESLHLPIQTNETEQQQQQAMLRPERRESLKPPPIATTRHSFGKRVRAKEIPISRPPMALQSQSKNRWPVRDSVITRQQQQRKRQIMKSLPPIPFDTGSSGPLFPALRSNPPNEAILSPIRSVGVADSPTYREPPYRSPTGNEWPLAPVKSDNNWI